MAAVAGRKARPWEHSWGADQPYTEVQRRRALGLDPEMEQARRCIEILRPLWRPGMSVLDAGCGGGHLYRSLRPLSPGSYLGIDAAPHYVAIGREAFAGDPVAAFQVGDVTALELPDKSFDVTVCLMVLPFLPHYRKALRELCRVTRGHLLVRLMLNDHTTIARQYHGPRAYAYYNTYEASAFLRDLRRYGATEAEVLDDGRPLRLKRSGPFSTWSYGRLQINGNILLTWRFVRAAFGGG